MQSHHHFLFSNKLIYILLIDQTEDEARVQEEKEHAAIRAQTTTNGRSTLFTGTGQAQGSMKYDPYRYSSLAVRSLGGKGSRSNRAFMPSVKAGAKYLARAAGPVKTCNAERYARKAGLSNAINQGARNRKQNARVFYSASIQQCRESEGGRISLGTQIKNEND
jgi:hypothetical protein